MASLNDPNKAGLNKLSELNMTKEEVDKIAEALKKPEFRKLLAEYAEEISNPENRKKYEEDIASMEREQGRDVQFIHPNGVWVLKSFDKKSNVKVFVNIATNDIIDKPVSSRTTQGSSSGLNWNIPHSLAPPREDVDKLQNKCLIVDVVFHPDTIRMAESNSRFSQMVNSIAIDAVCKNFGFELDKEKWKVPKNLKYKGRPQAAVVRKPVTTEGSNATADESNNESSSAKNEPHKKNLVETKVKSIVDEVQQRERVKNARKKAGLVEEVENSENLPKKSQPMHTVVYSKQADMQDFVSDRSLLRDPNRPSQIRVTIELPGIHSAADVQLDIFERLLHLESNDLLLDLPLSYPVDESNSSAKFDKKRHSLTVVMPVVSDKNATIVSNEADDSPLPPVNNPLIVELGPNKPVEVISHENVPPNRENTAKATTLESNVVKMMPDIVKAAEALTAIELQVCGRKIDFDSVNSQMVDQGKAVQLNFTSCGQGGFPIFYQLIIQSSEDNQKKFSNYTIHHESDAVIGGRIRLFLAKEKSQIWNECRVGTDSKSLEPLQLELDASIAPLAEEGSCDKAMRIISVTSCSSADAPFSGSVHDSDDDEFNIDSVQSASSPHRNHAAVTVSSSSPPGGTRSVTFDVGAEDVEGDLESVFIFNSQSELENFIPLDDDYDEDEENSSEKPTVIFDNNSDPGKPSILKSSSSIENICDEPSPDGRISRRRVKSVSFSDRVDNLPFHKAEPAAAICRTLKNRRRRERRRSVGSASVSPRDENNGDDNVSFGAKLPQNQQQQPSQKSRRSHRRRTVSAGSIGSEYDSSPALSFSCDDSVLSLSSDSTNGSSPDVATNDSSFTQQVQSISRKDHENGDTTTTNPIITSTTSPEKTYIDNDVFPTPSSSPIETDKASQPNKQPEKSTEVSTMLDWGEKPAPPSKRYPFELSNSLMYELDASG